jgi:cytochrome P450
MTASTDRLATSDPYLPGGREFIRDPYPWYERLRTEDPVHWSEADHAWYVSRYDDVLAGVRDSRLSARRMPLLLGRAGIAGPHASMFEARAEAQMISADPPDHTRLRGLASRAFTPRRMADIRPRVAEIAHALLDRAIDVRDIDVVADYAYPLPMTVIGELLGIPDDDLPKVKGWADSIAGFMSSGRIESSEIEGYLDAWQGLSTYVRDLARHRTVSDDDEDIVGLLLRRLHSGDATEEEVVANLVLFAVAGHETTTNTLTLGLWTLLRNPDEMVRLRADPGLIGSAVEEILRYEPTSQRTIRVATKTVTIGGREIPTGSLIVFLLGAANRDPEAFPQPDTFDVGRSPNRHLTFSQGIHFCLGAPLARLELQEALVAILRRTRSIEWAGREPEWRANVRMRGLERLQATLIPA